MKILELILQNTKIILCAVIMFLFMLLLRQCNSAKTVKEEVTRITNNQLALNDTLVQYVDKNGILNGEIRGLHLKLDELGDTLKYEKNKPPITIISYFTEIRDSIIFIPTIDAVIIQEDGTFLQNISFIDSSKFKRSSRIISFDMAILSNDSILGIKETNIKLNQNIWLEASILKDLKSKEIYVHLKTDYPGITFNDAKGILVQNDKQLKKLAYSQRKQFGLGIQIGVGYSGRILPYMGIGVHYSPKFLQW